MELKKVCTERSDRRTAPALDHVIKAIENKARFNLGYDLFIKVLFDLRTGFPFIRHIACFEHNMTDTGGQVARIDDIDIADMLGRGAGIVIA